MKVYVALLQKSNYSVSLIIPFKLVRNAFDGNLKNHGGYPNFFGGNIDYGDQSITEALRREVNEESRGQVELYNNSRLQEVYRYPEGSNLEQAEYLFYITFDWQFTNRSALEVSNRCLGEMAENIIKIEVSLESEDIDVDTFIRLSQQQAQKNRNFVYSNHLNVNAFLNSHTCTAFKETLHRVEVEIDVTLGSENNYNDFSKGDEFDSYLDHDFEYKY